MENRFESRELTIGELILWEQMRGGNLESGVCLLESRRKNKAWSIRDLPVSELETLCAEMRVALEQPGMSSDDIKQIVIEVDEALKKKGEEQS